MASQLVSVLSAQLCPALCDLMDCSPSGASVHGVLQARIMKWVAILFSRGYSQPGDLSQFSCIAGRFFTVCATREALNGLYPLGVKKKKEPKKSLYFTTNFIDAYLFGMTLRLHLYFVERNVNYWLIWKIII